jgi:hypothetical protein
LLIVGAKTTITIATRATNEIRRICARSNMMSVVYFRGALPSISSNPRRSKPA